MSKIFISYARKYEEFARRLGRSLDEVGFDAWLDVKNIPAGADWSNAIHGGLDAASLMILIVAPESMESKEVGAEWKYYLSENKPIIPIVLVEAKIHYRLQHLQRIDFSNLDTYNEAFQRLWSELNHYGIGATMAQYAAPLQAASGVIELPQEPITWHIMPEPFAWCQIPAGKVTINYSDTEKQIFEVESFYIAKYPITNRQYDVFINDEHGYRNEKWWEYSDAMRAWHLQMPEPSSTAHKGSDLPRTNVSWYEAVAFCRWLDSSLKKGSQENMALQIMLPTEQQWQRAAQGDDERLYPWGDTPDLYRCNTAESKIHQPIAVSKYPQGASSFDVMDMSGNVWEWCLDTWIPPEKYDEGRYVVAKGGAYDHTIDHADVKNRFKCERSGFSYARGFRIVACPI